MDISNWEEVESTDLSEWEEVKPDSELGNAGKRALGGNLAFWDIPGSLAGLGAKIFQVPGAVIAGAMDPHARVLDYLKELKDQDTGQALKPSTYIKPEGEVKRGFDAANKVYDFTSEALGKVGKAMEHQAAAEAGRPVSEYNEFAMETGGELLGGSLDLVPGAKVKGVVNKPRKPPTDAETAIAQREFQVYLDKLSKGKEAEAQIARERFEKATQGELPLEYHDPVYGPSREEAAHLQSLKNEPRQLELFNEPYAAPVFEGRTRQGGELPMAPRDDLVADTAGFRVDPNDPFLDPFLNKDPTVDPTQTPSLEALSDFELPRGRVEGRFAPKDPGHLNLDKVPAPKWTLDGPDSASMHGADFLGQDMPQIAPYIEKNDLNGALDVIAKDAASPFQREIASALRRLNMKDVGLSYGIREGDLASYRAYDNAIYMDPKSGGDPSIVLHEAVHAAVFNLQRLRNKPPAARAMEQLHKILMTKPQMGDKYPYALRNPYELVAEGMSNPHIAQWLDNTTLSRAEVNRIGGQGRIKTAWDAVVDFIRKLLGMPISKFNALDEFLRQAIDLMKMSNQEIRNADLKDWMEEYRGDAEARMADQADPWGGKGATTVNKFVVKTAQGHNIYDHRNAQEFVMGEDWSKVEDLKMGRPGQHFFQGGNIAAVARKTPMVRWLYNKVQEADRKATINSNNLLHGNTYRKGMRGWDKKQRKDYTGMITWLRENQSNKAGEQVAELIRTLDAEGRDLTPQDMAGMTAAQKQAVQAIRSGFDKMQRDINQSAMNSDHSPIGFLKGYFPHQMLGDWMIIIKDQDGKVVRAKSAKNEKEARVISEDLKNQFPNMEVKHVERKSRYDINDMSAFRETMGLLDKTSPEYKIIDKAYNQVLAHRGFAKHGLQRKGTSSYFGEDSVKDMVDAIEMYTKRTYRFIANMEKRKQLADLGENMKQAGRPLADYPNAEKFMDDYLDNSTGALENKIEVLDNIAEYLGKQGGKRGMGNSQSVKQGLGQLGSLASLYFLTTPKFLLTNLVQHLMATPKLQELKTQFNLSDSVVLNMGAMYKELFFPSKQTIDAMNYAKKHGYVDSKIAELLGDTIGDHSIRGLGKFTKDKVTGILGWQDQEMVRTPAYIAFERMLRKAIPEKELRYRTAGELTATYMMNYSRNERPLAYGKTGLLGQAMAPLKTYMHGYYGQFLEYLTAIKHEKTAKPLAMFLGVQALLSGLGGMLFVEEYDKIAKMLNSTFELGLPTMEEFLVTHDLGDVLTFGGVSAITGIDMSGSLSAPAGNSMFSAPGVGLAGKMAMDAGNYAGKTIRGTQTDADLMRVLKTFSPNIAHGSIEDAFTQPGKGPPNPYNKMNPQTSPRTSEDRWIRNVIGGRSTKEARELAQQRAVKAEHNRFRGKKEEIADAIIERILNNQDTKALEERYFIKYKGNERDLMRMMFKRLTDRELDAATRYLGKNPSPERVERLEKFKSGLQDWAEEEMRNE